MMHQLLGTAWGGSQGGWSQLFWKGAIWGAAFNGGWRGGWEDCAGDGLRVVRGWRTGGKWVSVGSREPYILPKIKKGMSGYRSAWPESVDEADEANDTRLGMLLE